ncbi:MAG: RsmE family RNA methyltransferase [Planctomycetota bacterium]|jgi:16S rRNA (uracil1498-N3)-methyltransferase
MMHRFHAADLGEPGSRVSLDAEETHHMVDVRRVRPGEEIALFDGAGREATARFVSLEGHRAVVEIATVREAECDAGVQVTLATAIPKGARMAQLVRSCTEIGVAAIRPMIAERSVVKPEVGKTLERMTRIAREAAKQSRRARVPEILPVASFDEVLAGAAEHDLALLADASAGTRPLREVLADRAPTQRVLVIVGPEGGFTDPERERAGRAGCLAARLECPVMRVETAAAAFVAVLVYAGSCREP